MPGGPEIGAPSRNSLTPPFFRILLEKFKSDQAIREFWSDTKTRAFAWGIRLDLISEENRCRNAHKKQEFESAKAVEVSAPPT